MLIKNTKTGTIQAVINKETFDLLPKGEITPEVAREAASKLIQLADYDAKVAEMAAQKAAVEAEIAALKPAAVVSAQEVGNPAPDATPSPDTNSPF